MSQNCQILVAFCSDFGPLTRCYKKRKLETGNDNLPDFHAEQPKFSLHRSLTLLPPQRLLSQRGFSQCGELLQSCILKRKIAAKFFSEAKKGNGRTCHRMELSAMLNTRIFGTKERKPL